jgi:hypothetical protein
VSGEEEVLRVWVAMAQEEARKLYEIVFHSTCDTVFGGDKFREQSQLSCFA